MNALLGKKLAQLSLLLGFLLLSGCGSFGPLPAEDNTRYTITESGNIIPTTDKTTASLYVAPTLSAPGYGSSDMLYVDKQYTLKHFNKNRWVAAPAQLMTPLIAQAMQKNQHFQAVISGASNVNTNWQLDTQLLILQQEFINTHNSQIKLSMRAQLVNVKTQRVIATKQIDVLEPAPTADPNGGAVAANHAVAQALTELSAFVVNATR